MAVGKVSTAVLADIGNAIREQNGGSSAYKPREMADAIRALTWARGPVLRCLWLGDGSMEFNFLEDARSVTGAEVIESFEVDMGGYASMSARPWEHLKAQVEHVVIDSSVADAGVKDCSYWFSSFSKLYDVTGFESLSGVTTFVSVFASCSQLRSVFATSFSRDSITSSWAPFQGCTRLVGGADCTACNGNGGSPNARITAGGFFTDPDNDNRAWLYGALFDDGTVEIDSDMPDFNGRTVVACGDFCANTRYAAVQCTPWAPYAKQVTKVSILPGAAAVAKANTCYWFYGCTALVDVSGFSNLRGTAHMAYCFNSCTSLASLDLRGFSPSALQGLGYAFAGCSSLETIYVLSSWTLPAVCAGMGTFYGDVKLVGGNGTAYSAENYHAQRCVVDKDGQPGYLTGVDG